MQTKSGNKKIFATVLVVLCLAFAAILLSFLSFTSVAAQADDAGGMIDYNIEEGVISLTLDANGKTGDAENNSGQVSANNSVNLKQRTILHGSLLAYAGGKWASGTYTLSEIYNDTTEYFTVKNDTLNIVISAEKSTSDRQAQIPRIAILWKNGNTGATEKMTVAITVNARNPDASHDTYYVGQLATGNDTSFPIKLTNYDSAVIDLEQYLVGRKLYTADPESCDRIGVSEDHVLKNDIGGNTANAEYLLFRDIGDYTFTSRRPYFSSVIGVDAGNVDVFADERSFVVSLNLTSGDVRDISNATGKESIWWTDEGKTYFELHVDIVNNGNTVTLYLPIAFVPDTEPKIKSNYGFATALNAGSTLASYQDPSSAAGYRTVRIYPEDLCDYLTYAEDTMWFASEEMPTYDSSDISIAWGTDEAQKVYYDVTGLSNSETVDVTFRIWYKSGNEINPKLIPVTFTVYGKYPVEFNIKGTKKQTFNIRSRTFSLPAEAGYQIVSAQLVKKNESDANSYASVVCENGIISITPQRSVFDQNTVSVSVTMVNKEGRRIVLDCPMQIDMKAGDLFSTWRTWQIVLFWVGIGLAVALVILLVVWLFIRSVHRHKMDELETTAPTSAYIIKLNSTIAAAQAQQRIATQGYGGAMPGQMLQLGAGPTSTPAPDPNTLALGATPQTMMPTYSAGATMPGTVAPGAIPTTTELPPINDEIFIPISDEELLLRIYEERFEPRGMLKRTFDKSKDLQQRELEREKERIREDVRNGMSIEEACKSLKQREAEAAGGITTMSRTATGESQPAQLDPLIAVLGFDPADPIIADVQKEELQEEWSAEEKKLKEAEYNNRRLHAELDIIESRIRAITAADEKTAAEIADANASVEALASGIKEAEQKLDDKNTDLAVERRKSAKEALNKEIGELESKIRIDKETMASRKSDVEFNTGLAGRIKEVSEEYADKKEATDALVAASDDELATARAEAQHAADLAKEAKRQAELKIKLETLNPLMETVNLLDGEIKELTARIENATSEKDSRKTRVAGLQNELLSTTDPTKITEISTTIQQLNKEVSELDRGATANTTLKSNKSIEMAAARRKANEFIDKEEIELEDVITAEDAIIAAIAHNKLVGSVEADKQRAEEAVAEWQNKCDTLTSELDANVMAAAAGVAERVKEAEDALAAAQAVLDDTNATLLTVEDEETRALTVELQTTQQDEVTRLTEELEAVRADGIKANLEFRTKGEEEIENARAELARATEDFTALTERFNEVNTAIDPLDLIASGSGVISQDRKKIEAENLKKLLAEQQSALEQAKLQAQLAQEEAEKAVADAQRASEESRAEAERLAQEALQKAEEAHAEAQRKTQEEAERMREETERVRMQAQEEIDRARMEAEEARRLAQEEAEKARQEAEEEAERARKEAEAQAEEARRLAEEEAERARKEAEEAAEKARKAAEEEAERIRLEQEESKRIAEEEAEKARIAAEEEAKRQAEEAQKLAEEEAKKKAIFEEKIAKRKAEITALRGELKDVADEEQGKILREKFYAIKLALDEDEKTSTELNDLLNKAMDDADHAAELSHYKKLANQKPRRVVKKVTERVNRIPKKRPAGSRPAGARPSGARPAGSRPAGARPSGARPIRPTGARPAGERPVGARPSGARPTRPTGARPSGTRPTRPTGKTPPRK